MQRGWVVNQRASKKKGEEEEELCIQHENDVHLYPSQQNTWRENENVGLYIKSIQCAHFSLSLSITLTDTHHRRERKREKKKKKNENEINM
jgi:hypothetical protein